MSSEKTSIILYVFYQDILIGELKRDDELVCSFTYSDGWLAHNDRFQLSLAMPFQREPFGNKITLSFFENLLPEGETRRALEKSQHTTGTFGFLKEFGIDCAGAIIVSQNKTSPVGRSRKSKKVQIEIKQIYDALKQKRTVAEVIAKLDPGYLSVAGAQDKFPAIFSNNKFYLPAVGQASTHIVKVPIFRSGVKESVFNEFFCMKLAKLVGLEVPDCIVHDDGPYPLFVIKRYDRLILKDDVVQRLHQQDFCQAQGVVSDQKYEDKGGPSLRDNYELIKKNVSIQYRRSALFAYLDWICFNLLIGNNDSHSKNLSLLLKDQKIQLAPFYDLICTEIYPKLKKNFSFMVGDRDDASRIGKNQLIMVDHELGLKKGTMVERMLLTRENILSHLEPLATEITEASPRVKIIYRIADLIKGRCKNLRQGL